MRSDPEVLATDLRACLGPLLRRLRQAKVDDELTPSQTAVLVRLYREGPSTSSALAVAEGVRPQSMGAIVAALVARGLVVRAPDPADGRRVVLSLSDTGRDGVRGARRERSRRLTAALRDELTADERALLAAAVPLLDRVSRRV
ncbi:HTH-type transcriptional repressor NicR [Actinomadura rubteroloni]|uniref:HTH-type transcriptional repressor NicR n=1 Tax=Actinomadura rubteroloni TaxID=1926885 RepID=A0A2P4UMZ6_9ACTN|nr:MarR family transcriptional regulator [Actinomadura rubteroloni]POM26415.1 HTH-type transcriptional repressor NicR [Actinomadura rubteroloni]